MNHSYPEYLAGPLAYCGATEINNSTQHINSKQMRENWDKTTYYDFSMGHISNIIHSRESINNISRKLPYPCSTWWTFEVRGWGLLWGTWVRVYLLGIDGLKGSFTTLYNPGLWQSSSLCLLCVRSLVTTSDKDSNILNQEIVFSFIIWL